MGFNRGCPDPKRQIIKYEFHNPFWYVRREPIVEYLQLLKTATYGYEALLGSRVFLYPHQIDTIIRAVSERHCRFILADEVGLGKTIEACIIIKVLKERNPELKTLIIAPESLIYQWKEELSRKFWMNYEICHDIADNLTETIIPLEKISSDGGKKVVNLPWDIIIVDETHKLLRLAKEYRQITNLSKKTTHILLLSATPIKERRNEFHKLLSLITPKRYGAMSDEDFDALLNKQEQISNRVYTLVRDIDLYFEDELEEEYRAALREISHIIDDRNFTNIIKELSIDSEDRGLSQVKLALAYLGEHYQLERHIIRHRRLELKDKLPLRSLLSKEYYMSGSDVRFYEHEVYEYLLEYLDTIIETSGTSKSLADYIKLCLSAMFSSPWALETLLTSRKHVLENHKKNLFAEDKRTEIIGSVRPIPDEKDGIDRILHYVNFWKNAVEDELQHINELYENPDNIRGRLAKVIDYLMDTDDRSKFVIFSTWHETIKALETFIKREFGEDAVESFYLGKDHKELQSAVDRFQSEDTCRFLLCDELGGEGRNFQLANEIIHVDLPWSPSDLEQRIGRLDRIGRQEEVLSVVFYIMETLEENLFDLWDKGLNIFQESISGLEIILEEIQSQIDNAICNDIRFGLRKLLDEFMQYYDELKNKVDEERYYEKAKQLDDQILEQLETLSASFNEEEKYGDVMVNWAKSIGLTPYFDKNKDIVTFYREGLNLSSARNAIYIPPPNMSDVHRRTARTQQVPGTFKRKLAIVRDNLVFFAPGDPFFDSIINNAKECYRGCSCAFSFFTEQPYNWEGFRFCWSASIDPSYILELGEPIQIIALIQGYLPTNCVVTYESVYPSSPNLSDTTLDNIFSAVILEGKKLIHFGKREEQYLGSFKRRFPSDEWQQLVEEAYKVSIDKAKDKIAGRIEYKKAENLC